MNEIKPVAWLCEYRSDEVFASLAASPMNDPDVRSALPLYRLTPEQVSLLAEAESRIAAAVAAEREACLLAFADFLHTLPDEDGYEVGPVRVKHGKFGLEDGPWWVTQDDTRRWARMFLDAAIRARGAKA